MTNMGWSLAGLAIVAVSLGVVFSDDKAPSPGPAASAHERPAFVITGLTEPARLGARHLVAAQTAFLAGRAELAPSSQLYFTVNAQDGGNLAGVELSLKRGEKIIPLALDAQSRFALPRLERGDWTLHAKPDTRGLAITPSVLSPGASGSGPHPGDLRLLCDVYRAMARAGPSSAARSTPAVPATCQNKMLGVSSRPIDTMTVERVTRSTTVSGHLTPSAN